MKRLAASGFVAALFLGGALAHADFIVAIAPGTNVTPIGLGPSGTDVGALTSRDFTSPAPIAPPSAFPPGTQVNNDDYVGPGAANPNQVRISLDVFAMNTPIDVLITTQPATSLPPAGDVIGPAEYFFTVLVTNRLNLNGVHPAVNGREIHNLDLILIPNADPLLAGTDLDAPSFTPQPVATGGPFPLGTGIPLSPTFLRFDGGGILPGQTATVTFSLDIPGTTNITPPSVFTLRFVANPEPGTMALAGVALGIGGYFARRRRNTPVSAEPVA